MSAIARRSASVKSSSGCERLDINLPLEGSRKVQASEFVFGESYSEGVPRDPARSIVVYALTGSLLVYAAIAAREQRWGSALAACIVSALLWWSHRRARFAAYVFFSALAVRGALVGVWALPLYAGLALAAMQTAAARRAWPRLVRGRLVGGDDRMRRS
jgi:hypothetical protein